MSIYIVNFSLYIILILIFAFAFCKWLLCTLTVNKGALWSTAILDVNPALWLVYLCHVVQNILLWLVVYLVLLLLHLLAVSWQGADSNHGATPRGEPIRSFEILCQGLYFLCSFACLINGLSKPVNISIIVSNWTSYSCLSIQGEHQRSPSCCGSILTSVSLFCDAQNYLQSEENRKPKHKRTSIFFL